MLAKASLSSQTHIPLLADTHFVQLFNLRTTMYSEQGFPQEGGKRKK
jgi:hypothetical protein